MKTLMQWTVEDYHKQTNLGMFRDHPVELLEGQLVEIASEGPTHAYLTEGIASYLSSLLLGSAFYAKAGIQEYWVLEIDLQQVNQVHRFLNPVRGTYESETIYRTGKIIPHAFANITVDVSKLWQ